MAAVGDPREVVLTDGNATSSGNLEKICDENKTLVSWSSSWGENYFLRNFILKYKLVLLLESVLIFLLNIVGLSASKLSLHFEPYR